MSKDIEKLNKNLKTEIEYSDNNILIKSMNMQEAEKYRLLRNRDDNRAYFFSSSLITEEQQKQWFMKYSSNDKEYMFAIYDKKNGDFAGAIGLYDIDKLNARAEIGRIIVDKLLFEGKGYGSRAICLLGEFAKEIGIREVVAYIYVDNIASQRSFVKSGFERTIEFDGKYEYIKEL